MRKLLLPLLSILLFTACQKEITSDRVAEEINAVAAKGGANKIDVCHKEGNGSFHTINISINALPAHLAHGDIVPDADGDDYTKVNPCGKGSQDDCDDTNAAINPGASEICGNNIDDNCNGQIDENCIVTICDQVWMLKNLDVTKYRNGDDIPQVTDPTEWANLTTGAWCWWLNNSTNGTTYGKLYNWYAVNDSRGLAPAGWHIPSDAEWTVLSDCLGGEPVAGGKMKSIGTTHWAAPNGGATNISGFTGLPGGSTFLFSGGYSGYWWSSTEYDITFAWYRELGYFYGNIIRNASYKLFGLSVRCLRD